MQVETQIDKGSCFCLFLPRAERPIETNGATAVSIKASGKGTVLVVEDDEHVMTLTELILKQAGYSVIRATAPQVALDEFLGTPVDMILSDVVMPGMSGPAFVKEWEAANGRTKVLYMSGYADETILTEHVSLDDLISKPFTAVGLAKRVGEVMTQDN